MAFKTSKPTAAQARADGLRAESLVKQWLKQQNYEVVDATDAENIYQDIDAHVRKLGTKQKWRTPVSIKANEPQYKDHAFLFELEQGWIDKSVEDADNEEELLNWGYRPYDINGIAHWVKPVPSWFYKGQAHEYLIWKRDSHTTGLLYTINKRKLLAHIKEHGFDALTETSGNAKVRERREGKAYTRIGLLNQSTLIDAGLALKVGYIA